VAPRIVSLVPSATETLVAWGADVVACTRFCEQPDRVHVGGTKDPDIDAIVALAPDLVVVDREENRREDAEALEAAGLEVHVLHVTSLATSVADLAELAARIECDPGHFTPPEPRPVRHRAFVPIWRRPWMSINDDTYAASVLSVLGVGLVTGSASQRYPVVELEEIAAAEPDLVLLPSEPYPFGERHVPEIRSALGDVAILCIDGADLVWWGARSEAAISRLQAVLDAATHAT
jgi:ABC-type hemin transport system substrate-binding protein